MNFYIAHAIKTNTIAQSNLGTGRVATNASADPTHHPNCSFDASPTFAQLCRKLPIGYNGRRTFTHKIPPPVDRSPNPTTCLIPSPIQPTTPNRKHIRSAVLPQYTGTNRRTDERTRCSFAHPSVLILFARHARETDENALGQRGRGIDTWHPLRVNMYYTAANLIYDLSDLHCNSTTHARAYTSRERERKKERL